MLYLGLDVHSKWTTVVGFDPETGEVVQLERVGNEPEAMAGALGSLPGPLHGVMEAGTNSWAIYRQLEPYFERLVVADAARLWERRKDRKAKTDRNDALRMAQLLFRGEIEGIWVPDERTQDLRSLVRAKVRASRWVTKLINEIGALLRGWGYVGARSLLTKKGLKELSQAQLPVRSQRVLELWQEMLEKAQQIEAELEAAIKQEAGKEPMCALLESVPAVGPFTALLLRAELGEIRRFPNAKALISYVGLAPRVFQSGERCRYGRPGYWGNRWLKYGLGLLANRISRSSQDSRLHRLYWRTVLRRDRGSGKMAVARKALQLIYHLLKYRESWQEPAKEQAIEAVA